MTTAPQSGSPPGSAIGSTLASRVRVAELISSPRLDPYLRAASGNLKDALRLYRWSLAVSGAAYEALAVVEVVLRNAMDVELSAWNGSQMRTDGTGPCSADWLLDPSRLLERLAGSDIDQAMDRCLNLNIAAPTHGDVLAQTSFGTWRYLLWSGDPGTQHLWNYVLRPAFPHCAESARDFADRVKGVHLFRNRVAHLEPMLNGNAVAARLTDMEQILAAIDPALEHFFTGMQRVTGVLAKRPL